MSLLSFEHSLVLKFLFLCIWPKLFQETKKAILFLEASYSSKISYMGMTFVLVCAILFLYFLVQEFCMKELWTEGESTGLEEMKEIIFMSKKEILV